MNCELCVDLFTRFFNYECVREGTLSRLLHIFLLFRDLDLGLDFNLTGDSTVIGLMCGGGWNSTPRQCYCPSRTRTIRTRRNGY